MEEENYGHITFLIEHTFKNEKLKEEVFFGEIPDSIVLDLNSSLDIDFKENIEYLLFYDDSLERTGKDGIAIVKKEDNYYLILKEHRNKPVIFVLYSEYMIVKINRIYFNEIDYVLCIETSLDVESSGEKYYYTHNAENPEVIGSRQYNFKFYNRRFLELFIQLCEQIEAELD